MIQISEGAARKIRSLMAKQGISDGGLRVGVKGGGCSGLSYTFAWEREPRFGDEVFDGEAGAGGFVGEHGADAAEAVVDIIHIDDRQSLLAELLHLEAAGDAGDDAVAAPAVGDRGTLFMIARVDQQVPMGVLLSKVGDAADDLATPA